MTAGCWWSPQRTRTAPWPGLWAGATGRRWPAGSSPWTSTRTWVPRPGRPWRGSCARGSMMAWPGGSGSGRRGARRCSRSPPANGSPSCGPAVTRRARWRSRTPVRERVSGPEHPDTLNDRGNLARWTGEAGDPERARDLYAALLPDCERILGPEHPDTLTTRDELDFWARKARGAD